MASPETDDFWLELSKKFTDNQIQALVSKTPHGCIPGDVDLADSLTRSVLKCPLDSHLSLMLDRAMRVHSLKKNEASTLAEVLGASIASYLADNPLDDEAEEKARREADKDIQAARARLVPEVAAVREMAVKMGLFEPDEEFEDLDPGRVRNHEDANLLDEAIGGRVITPKLQPQKDPGRVQILNDSTNLETAIIGSRQERATGTDSCGAAFSDPNRVRTKSELGADLLDEAVIDRVIPPQPQKDPGRVQILNGLTDVELVGLNSMQERAAGRDSEAPSTADVTRVHFGENSAGGLATGHCSCGHIECSGSQRPAHFVKMMEGEASFSDPGRVQIPSDKTTELLAEALGIASIDDNLLPLINPDRVQYVTLDDPWASTRVRFNIDSRYATTAQKKEILRRDGWCCGTPGCCNRIWLHIHHLEPFADGGKTSPRNLLGLCSACHKNVHDGLLKIERQIDGSLVFLDQDGRRLDQQVDLEIAYWLDFEIGWTGGEQDSYKARCGIDWAVFAA